jgi:hypothetical protein
MVRSAFDIVEGVFCGGGGAARRDLTTYVVTVTTSDTQKMVSRDILISLELTRTLQPPCLMQWRAINIAISVP